MTALRTEGRTPAEEQPLGRAVRTLVVLVLVTEVVALSFQLVTPALVEMSATFRTTQVAWVITILSLVGAVQSLGSSAGVQVIFIVLALDVIAVAGGQPIYAGSSYTIAFVLVAGLCVLAVAAAGRKAKEEGQ